MIGCFIFPAHSALIVNDTWADSTRDDTELPDDSAWYAQSTSSLVASAGALTGTANATSSRLWLTYFTTTPSQPVQVPDGEVIKVTLEFTPNSINTGTNSRGVRIGLFDYSAGTRLTSDFNSSALVDGTAVRGYMLSINFTPVFAVPLIEIWKRTDLAHTNLMGTTAAFTSLGTGGGVAGDLGFSNDVLYTLEFTVMRRGEAVDVGARFLGPDGWSVSHSVTDTNASPVDRFDTFAVRWERPDQTAASVMFTRFKVEAGPPVPPFRIASIERLPPENLRLTWASVPGKIYEVQASEDLGQDNWIPLDRFTAAEASSSFTDIGILALPQRFYRVVEMP